MNQREYREVMFNSEVPYPQRILYAYLRSCVDYRTGVVGDADNKRISYQAIREALEFTRAPGSKSRPEVFSRQRIFKLLGVLEQRGFVVSLESEIASSGRRPTIRKYLPLAVGGSIRAQEEVYSRFTKEGYTKTHAGRDFHANGGYKATGEEGDTSVSFNSLSHSNKYIYYDPDEADESWLRYLLGQDAHDRIMAQRIDMRIEPETFNLRYCRDPDYNMAYQREDWRLWMIRALQHKGVL